MDSAHTNTRLESIHGANAGTVRRHVGGGLLAVSVGLTLAACAGGVLWTGGNPQTLARDEYECQMSSENMRGSASAPSMMLTGPRNVQASMHNFAQGMAIAASGERVNRFYTLCMEARGWRRQSNE